MKERLDCILKYYCNFYGLSKVDSLLTGMGLPLLYKNNHETEMCGT
jgi:hypothetical protein